MLPASERRRLGAQLAQTAGQPELTQVPIVVYIDSAHLVRRLIVSTSAPFRGTQAPVSLTLDYLAYGQQPAPAFPAASDTFDVTSWLSSDGRSLAGG